MAGRIKFQVRMKRDAMLQNPPPNMQIAAGPKPRAAIGDGENRQVGLCGIFLVLMPVE